MRGLLDVHQQRLGDAHLLGRGRGLGRRACLQGVIRGAVVTGARRRASHCRMCTSSVWVVLTCLAEAGGRGAEPACRA